MRDHPDVLAKECGVPLKFVKGVYILWVCLASSLPICPDKFQQFCDDIKDCYLESCAWYNLSPTLHKILVHGSQVIQLFPDTITSGMLSEEPGEASNKTLKHFQAHHARQDSAENRNLSVFHRMMDRSDPQIVHHFTNRQKTGKAAEVFPKAVLDLCKDSDQLIDELKLLE